MRFRQNIGRESLATQFFIQLRPGALEDLSKLALVIDFRAILIRNRNRLMGQLRQIFRLQNHKHCDFCATVCAAYEPAHRSGIAKVRITTSF